MTGYRFSALGLAVAAAMLAVPGRAAWADQPRPWQMVLQDAASPTMAQIHELNAVLNVVVVGVPVLVCGIVVYALFRFRAGRNPTPARWAHNTPLELAWTTLPVLVLVLIAFPSFRLLYSMDRIHDAELTVKVTGHQWYWSYAYPDSDVAFDANMVATEDLKPGQPRLLEADHRLVLPVGENVRVVVTSEDVIHSWAVPAFGIKTDAIPGRLNETWVRIERPGVYYGQCSQLCGVNHGFMPIAVEAVPRAQFDQWLAQAKAKAALGQPPTAVAAISPSPANGAAP